MRKTIYLNLEDDVAKVAAKVKAQKTDQLTLVIPKQSYLFADSINLRLLKKQLELYKKDIDILTMDEKGQIFAKEAGFKLKFLPRMKTFSGLADVGPVSDAKKVVTKKPVTSILKPESTVIQSPVKRVIAKKPVVDGKINSRQKALGPQVEVSKVFQVKSKIGKDKPVEAIDGNHGQQKNQFNRVDNVFMSPKDNKPPKRKTAYWKALVFLVVVAVLLAGILHWVVLPSADVVVYANSQPINRDVEVLIDSNAANIDSARLTLPGTKVEQTVATSSNFNVNGKKEIGSQAEGRVAIYNLTGAPITLKAGTTTLTVGDKTYSFKADQRNVAALPSANNDNSATLADVIASGPGESFNLPSGTRMEISNKSFGNQPSRLYAKAITQIVGGSSRFISVLTEQDIEASKAELAKQAVSKLNETLSVQKQALIEGAYKFEAKDFSSNQTVGLEATKFTASANTLVYGVAFDETLLKEMIRARIQQTIGQDKTLQDASIDKASYKIKNINLESGIVQLSVAYESKSLPKFDKYQLFISISGMSKQEAESTLKDVRNLNKVEILLKPSWQKNLPRLSNKVNITVQYVE